MRQHTESLPLEISYQLNSCHVAILSVIHCPVSTLDPARSKLNLNRIFRHRFSMVIFLNNILSLLISLRNLHIYHLQLYMLSPASPFISGLLEISSTSTFRQIIEIRFSVRHRSLPQGWLPLPTPALPSSQTRHRVRQNIATEGHQDAVPRLQEC
jgi:hypothetical protein